MLRVGITKYGSMRPECINVPGSECEAGFELELFSLLTNFMRMKIEIKISTETGCGYLRNGTWSGLIGMLQRNEIDIIGNLCLLDQERITTSEVEKWIDYSYPVFQPKQSFLIKAPVAKYGFNLFSPFQTETWLAVLFGILCFAVIIALFYKFLFKITYTSSITSALSDVFHVISGLNAKFYTKYISLHFICFYGFVTILYSTFITSVIVKPLEIQKPFKDSDDLAKVLYDGSYKILDYTTSPYIKCYNPETCNRISEAVRMHGVHLYMNPLDSNFVTKLLNELLTNPNLVFVRNRVHLRILLNEFSKRDKLWLLKDEGVGEDWYVYYIRSNDSLIDLIDNCLITMGSGKETVQNLYLSSSRRTPDSATIKGGRPEMATLDMSKLTSIVCCYTFGIVLAVVCLLLEFFLNRSASSS